MSARVDLSREVIAGFCRRNRIRKLSLFGSVIRDDFRPESDVDVLVEFEDGAMVGYFDLSRMERELSEVLGGRKVDLNTVMSLSKYYRDEVLKEAEPQFVAA